MSMLGKIVALASGMAAAAAVASVAIVPRHGARDDLQSAATPPSQSDVKVCVGPDGVLRAAHTGDGCPAGQSQLKQADGTTDGPQHDPSKNDPIADLERRLANLERSPLFTVVDKKGHPIFAVSPEKVVVYNASQQAVAGIRATADGGLFTSQPSDGSRSVSVGASGSNAGVRVLEGGVARVDFGKQPGGNYALKFTTPQASGGTVAAIGESRAGSGALLAGDAAGHLQASITVLNGGGVIGVASGAGATILSLMQSMGGGGMLVAAAASGEPMVKMGVNEDRYGFVLTGPAAGFPLVTGSGLPGSYFLGCAGGTACRPY